MTAHVVRKWRPTLGMIVFAVLTTVMALPLVGLFFFRLYENQLVRETEAELIAQSAALAAIFAREAEATPGLALGNVVTRRPSLGPEGYWPIEASLDLTAGLLGRRPDGQPAAPADPAFVALGDRLQPVVQQTQLVTLAGFRLLDPRGVVIAGREEHGLSLAHVEEVADALRGRYRAVLRTRMSDQPPPPVYSLSRGTGVRVFSAMPVIVGDRIAGVVYASRTPSNVLKHMYSERRKFILASLAVLGATLALGFLVSRAITGPIHALVARTREVGHGSGATFRPLAHHGTREIALLSQSFAEMAERLNERSDYIATFAAHVSHELKTPLTSIRGAAELMRDAATEPSGEMTAAERARFLGNIIADTTRATTLLNRLRELARADNPHVGGSTTLSATVSELRRAFPELRIEAAGELGRAIAMSEENAAIVFSHLADNAVRHKAGRLGITAFAEPGMIRVEIADDGEGVSAKNRGKIFDPFFTTRRESGGTGMGLGIVQAMLRAHGGSIRLIRGEQGAVFEVRIRVT